MTPIKKAIFPVGGLGTRFLPATKSVPKEMLPVAAKPLIQYAFEEALEAGIEEFIFITGRNKNAINNHFNHAFELQTLLSDQEKKGLLKEVKDWLPDPGKIMFIPQQDPLGLGHAVWCARHVVKDEPFAVILADEMVLSQGKGAMAQMMRAYDQHNGNIVAVAEVAQKDTHKYGMLDPKQAVISADQTIIEAKGMVEKPKPAKAPSNLSLTGRYLLQPQIFEILEQQVLQKKQNGQEIQLTDAMRILVEKQSFYGYRFEGKRFDCGSLVGFLEANIAYSLENKNIADDVKAMLSSYQQDGKKGGNR